MKQKTADMTSALLDDELDPETRQQVISAMLNGEGEELERFGRYRLIGDVMRGESSVLASSVTEEVRLALADEPVVLAPRPPRPVRWLRPAVGIAVAASVAAAAIYVASPVLTSTGVDAESVQLASGGSGPGMAPVLVAAQPAPDTPQGPQERRWRALNRDLEARLNRLVIEHQEFGGRTGLNGPVPHIGLVSYGTR